MARNWLTPQSKSPCHERDGSEATLERWRSEGLGPRFLKLQGRVLYRLVDIEPYEASCLSISTTRLVSENVAA